jgi:hypothetical protein
MLKTILEGPKHELGKEIQAVCPLWIPTIQVVKFKK